MKNKKAILTKMIHIGLERATTPQTGWSIFQKIKNKISVSGNDVCIRMKSMWEQGLIERTGYDDDFDSMYIALPKEIDR